MKISSVLAVGFASLMVIVVAAAYFGGSLDSQTPKIVDSVSVEESISISPNIDADQIDIEEKVTVEINSDVL